MTDDLNRLRADERATLLCDVGCEGEHSRYCAAAMPGVYKVQMEADDLTERVESIVAARTTALLDRIERAETERDEAWRQANALNHDLSEVAETLDALRAAVTNLADEWMARTPAFLDSHKQHAAEMLDRLLAAAPTEKEGGP